MATGAEATLEDLYRHPGKAELVGGRRWIMEPSPGMASSAGGAIYARGAGLAISGGRTVRVAAVGSLRAERDRAGQGARTPARRGDLYMGDIYFG